MLVLALTYGGKLLLQGHIYREKRVGAAAHPQVALVLGAGNQVAVAVTDILHKMFVEDCVVVCKINPVCDYTGKFVREMFEPLIKEGFLEVVHGGVAQGKFLCEHPLIDSIHLTGSSATFDAIFWGLDNPKKEGEPICQKAVGAELGCVTPYIVVPGNWGVEDINYYAEEVVAGLVHNAGHNCLKAEDIGSGNCAVHNGLLLDHPQKSVLHVPWRLYPTHLWSPVNRNLEAIVRSAFWFFNSPSLISIAPLAFQAVLG
eukprot:jgi/Botrbrau1/21498/Bobra.174_2s0007.1